MIGSTFGRLTVICHDKPRDYKRYWICRCECGVEKSIRETHLKQGLILSCGCHRIEAMTATRMKHGHGRREQQKSTYKKWMAMRRRCNNPNEESYPSYGGRGISVCARWDSYANFLDDMGECPLRMTLDRIDPDGNYEPRNCRWASWAVQAKNKRNAIVLTLNGEIMILADWARKLGIRATTLQRRYHAGWSTERILAPVR